MARLVSTEELGEFKKKFNKLIDIIIMIEHPSPIIREALGNLKCTLLTKED
jgi:hypothetical protein